MEFYDPNGEKIGPEDFIEIYSDLYYQDGRTNWERLPRISVNSRAIESSFDDLLKKRTFSRESYRDIMAWKTGMIDQKDSGSDGFKFRKEEWNEVNEEGKVRLRSDLELGKLLESMERLNADFKNDCSWEEADAKDFLRDLKDEKIKGLGTVYMITLLYFQSGGVWPIYDRFAAMGLIAIREELKPDWKDEKVDGKIAYIAPPSKDSSQFDQVVDRLLIPFKNAIADVFGLDKYKSSRDIDRALWVYGHLFKPKKWLDFKDSAKNKCCTSSVVC